MQYFWETAYTCGAFFSNKREEAIEKAKKIPQLDVLFTFERGRLIVVYLPNPSFEVEELQDDYS